MKLRYSIQRTGGKAAVVVVNVGWVDEFLWNGWMDE